MTPPFGAVTSITLAFLASAGPVGAQSVAEVVVRPAKIPQLVASYPADGASLPGGVVVMKLVFDQPMQDGGWSYSPSPEGAFPDCLARPRLLEDRRTFVLLCSLPLTTKFAVRVNGAPDFTGASGKSAPAQSLIFETTDRRTTALQEALKAAGLSLEDDPIMGKDAAPGAIAAAPKRP